MTPLICKLQILLKWDGLYEAVCFYMLHRVQQNLALQYGRWYIEMHQNAKYKIGAFSLILIKISGN